MESAKLVSIVFTPWRKYSDYFDKNCWGIWGLSTLLKFTLLFLALFFVPPIFGIVDYESTDTGLFFAIMVMVFLLIAFFWLIYLPILGIILIKRTTEKTIEVGSKIISYLSRDPMLVPDEVKKEPNSFLLFIRALQYWWFIYSTKLIYKHRKTLEELTTIYPISLLFQNKMWHARNQRLWKTLRKIEAVAKKANMQIDIDEIGVHPYYHFWAHFKKKGSFPIKKLEKALQDYYGTIYVRSIGKRQVQINTTIAS